MSALLPFVVVGTATGALYGLAASGLVLTYKTSGIFNFAHGAIGAGTAYVFHELRDERGVPAVLALLLAAGVVAPLLGVVLSALAGRLAGASTVRRVVATVGVLLLVQGLLQLRYGIAPLPATTSFPTSTFRVADVNVGYDQVITVAIAVAGVAALELLFRRTRLGLQMRAVVDDGELLDLTGTAPAAIRAAAWAIGSAFAGLSGVLLAPAVGLDALLLTLVVVQAFGAAAIGRFGSTTAAFLGGIGLGIVAALIKAPSVVDAAPFLGDLPGLDQSLPFLVLFGVLVLTRAGTFSERPVRRAPRSTAHLPRWAQATAGALAVVALLVVPQVADARLPVFTLGAVFVTIYASLHLLVEVSGQVSLCHTAFVAVGATTFCHLTTGLGLPWGFGVAGAALAAVPIGAFVAIPAIRLSGLYLALATLGFGVLVEQLLYARGFMFGAIGQRTGSRPALLGLDSDRGYFWLCAGVAAAALLLVVVVRRSQLGRLLDALADSPVALVTHGASVNVTRTLVFCLSAALAAVAGALDVGVVGSISSAGVSAGALVSFNSLLWLVVLAFVGRHVVVSPVLAAFALVVAPSYSSNPDTAQILTVAFGLAAVLAATFGEEAVRAMAAATPAGRDRLRRSPVRERTAAAAVAGAGAAAGVQGA